MVAKYDFSSIKTIFTTNLIIFTTLFYDSDNIFSIGLTAFSLFQEPLQLLANQISMHYISS